MISGGISKVDSFLRAINQFEVSPQGFRDVAKAVVDAGLDFLKPLAMELQRIIKVEPKTVVGASRFGKAPSKISSSNKRADALANALRLAWAKPESKEFAAQAFAEWFNREVVPTGVYGRDIHGKV